MSHFPLNHWQPAEYGVPPGIYQARIRDSAHTLRRNGTSGYQAFYEVIEGPFTRRVVTKTMWLTPAAMRYTAPWLAKFGIYDARTLQSHSLVGFGAQICVSKNIDCRDGREYTRVDELHIHRHGPQLDDDGPRPPSQEAVEPC